MSFSGGGIIIPFYSCSDCGGLLRPHVIWFGEPLDTVVMDKAHKVLRECDLCLLVRGGGGGIISSQITYVPWEREGKCMCTVLCVYIGWDFISGVPCSRICSDVGIERCTSCRIQLGGHSCHRRSQVSNTSLHTHTQTCGTRDIRVDIVDVICRGSLSLIIVFTTSIKHASISPERNTPLHTYYNHLITVCVCECTVVVMIVRYSFQ